MIYFLLILMCVLSSVAKKEQMNSKVYQYTLMSIIIFFISTGYMCGTDWRSYELIYQELGASTEFMGGMWYMEPFYVLLNILFSKLHVDFWHFFILLKIFIAICLFKTLKENCPSDLFYLAVLFFLAFFGFFMLVDNPMRNVIAVAITSLAMPYLFKGKALSYYLIVFVAVLFHYSAVFMLLLYPIVRCRIAIKWWLLIYVIVNIIFLKPDILFQMAAYLLSPFPFISWKVDSYMEQLDTVAGGKLFSLGLLVHFLFFICILYSRKKIEAIPNGKYIFNMAVLFPIVFRMGLTSLVFSRFQLYLAVFYTIAICCVIYCFSIRSRIYYKIGVIIVSCYSCYNIVTGDYRYIPYTNYFVEKMFNREMSYGERSNYNKIYSPYRNRRFLEE